MEDENERSPLLDRLHRRDRVMEKARPINEGPSEDEIELSGCGATPCCNPRGSIHRFIVLFFICILSFGSYFCYDNPGPLQPRIKEDMDVQTSEYMLLYSLYSYPNVILCFFGGFLIDRVFGIRLGAIIFSAFVMAGQVVFAVGAMVNHYWLMCLGRFIFGIGGESLAVSQNTYAVSWFKDKELNMVFGLQLSVSRVGSVVNFNTMERIYDWLSGHKRGYLYLGYALLFASLLCILSFVCSLILSYFDRRAERILNKKAGETGEVIRFRDIKDFSFAFWLLTIICVTYYVTIFPFIGLSNEFFIRKYGFSSDDANLASSLVYTISAIASPLLGFCIDKIGRNLMWALFAITVTLACHVMLGFSFVGPYIVMSIMGISYSMLASSLWPMITYVIPEHQLGTAYGIMQSVQNLGLAVCSQLSGIIVDSSGYMLLEVFNLGWLCGALISTILLWIIDASHGNKLNLSTAQRMKLRQELEAAECLEREKLFASGSMADITPQDLLQSRSDFAIRNSYLSRLGAALPPHYDISISALVHRNGLK